MYVLCLLLSHQRPSYSRDFHVLSNATVILSESFVSTREFAYKQQTTTRNCLARRRNVVLQDNYNSANSLLSELHWFPHNKRISKLLHLRTSHLRLVSSLISLQY